MIIEEIKHFNLEVGEYTDIEVDLPSSVLTALIGKGIIPEPYYGENLTLCRGISALGARFTSTFEIDTLLFGMEHLEIRIGGITAGAVLFINGTPKMRLEYPKTPYVVDVRRDVHLGNNTIELRFDPREGDIASDISIYEKIELIAYNGKIIDRVSLSPICTAESVTLGITMTTRGRNIPTRAMATLVSPGGSVSYAPIMGGVGEMQIKAPNLWWPGNMGAHNLYRLTVNLYSENELIDSKECRIGLRSVDYDAEKRRLTVSGKPLYEFSLDLSEIELIETRITDAKARLAIRRAGEAGVNLIYASAANTYPSDTVLNAADEYGVGFAVELTSRYTGESEIEKHLVRDETERLLSRLSVHPSVLMLYGLPEYADIVRDAAEKIIPSAVYIPDLRPVRDTVASTLPEISTLDKYFPKTARNIFSPALAMRGSDGVKELLFAVVKDFLMPTGFEGWRYLSNFIATQNIKEKLSRARCNLTDTASPTMTLLPPLPALSPSLLDYSAAVKPAWYAMQKATRPTTAYGELGGTRVNFYISNLTTKVYDGTITYMLIDNKNTEVMRSQIPFSVSPRSGELVSTVDFAEPIRGHEREYYLYYYATDSAVSHSHATVLFIQPRSFEFLEPGITYDIHGASSNYTLTLKADAFARGVEISFLGDDDVTLSDNYFDITSEVPVRITLKTERPTALETLEKNIRITSFYFASHD